VNNSDQSPYENILTPVDFTEAPKTAIEFVADFWPQAKLHLLHAYKGPFQDYLAMLSLAFSREERAKFARPMGERAVHAMSILIDS
jgi:hypothetical protein